MFVVHGNWGKWGNWSECSKTCGDGEKTRSRVCNDPAPMHGGIDCKGDTVQKDSCKIKECPGKILGDKYAPWNSESIVGF